MSDRRFHLRNLLINLRCFKALLYICWPSVYQALPSTYHIMCMCHLRKRIDSKARIRAAYTLMFSILIDLSLNDNAIESNLLCSCISRLNLFIKFRDGAASFRPARHPKHPYSTPGQRRGTISGYGVVWLCREASDHKANWLLTFHRKGAGREGLGLC